MRASITDLRFRTVKLLAAIDRGEEVLITHRGRPRARLVGITEQTAARPERNFAFGIWADHDAPVSARLRRLRAARRFA